jgi:hypothetical protein
MLEILFRKDRPFAMRDRLSKGERLTCFLYVLCAVVFYLFACWLALFAFIIAGQNETPLIKLLEGALTFVLTFPFGFIPGLEVLSSPLNASLVGFLTYLLFVRRLRRKHR